MTEPQRKALDPQGTWSSFSLINVCSRNPNGRVNGYWIQNHTAGTLASAKEAARRTEAANSNQIEVAVVAYVRHPVAVLHFWENLVQLS